MKEILPSSVVNIPASPASPAPFKKAAKAIDRVLFPNTAWFLLLLIPLVFFGFRPGYWAKLPGKMDTIIHVHTALMMGWVLMGLVQPILILKKKVQWHRIIGKASYVLMPLLLVSGYFLIQHRYYRMLARINGDVAAGKVALTTEQVYSTAAASLRLGLVYFILLALLYGLAIANRKRFLQHATYMFGAILTVLGPAAGRIVSQVYKYNGLKMNFWGAYSTEFFTLLVFAALSIYHKRKGQSIVPALVVFSIYMGAILALEFLPKTKAWQTVVEAIV